MSVILPNSPNFQFDCRILEVGCIYDILRRMGFMRGKVKLSPNWEMVKEGGVSKDSISLERRVGGLLPSKT